MKSILTKLNAIQRQLKAPKNQKNSFGNYYYRSQEDILEAVKPLLDKNKCTLILGDECKNIGGKNYIESSATIYCIETGESLFCNGIAREAESKKGMDDSQLTGSTSSYARKYALNGLFCIDDTKDADSTNTHDKEEPSKTEVILLKISECKTVSQLNTIGKQYKDIIANDAHLKAFFQKKRDELQA